jgi:creatinine amidohydrolase
LSTDPSRPVLWAEHTEPELERARDAGALVLIPLGAMEQHGAHLPVDTDTAISLAVASAVAGRRENTLVAPAIAWGYSAPHMGFASTLSLRPETLTALLEDLCGSLLAHGFTKIAIVASHGTNRPIGNTFVREAMARHGATVAYIHYTDFAKSTFQELRVTPPGGEMHAGEMETSLQLHLNPELVRMELAEHDAVDPKRHFGVSTAAGDIFGGGNISVGYDIRQKFPTGVMGDPREATAELGRAVFDAAVEGIVAVLDEFCEWEYEDRGRDAVMLQPSGWHA